MKMLEQKTHKTTRICGVINRKLLPMKIYLLFYFGGFSALYPYLTIHMKSVGITVTQTGLLFAIYPICNCLGAPIAGILGDKSGRFKVTLIGVTLFNILFHLLILFAVPVYHVSNQHFNGHFTELEVQVFCDSANVSSRETEIADARQHKANLAAACHLVTGVPGPTYEVINCITRCSGMVSINDCSQNGCWSTLQFFNNSTNKSQERKKACSTEKFQAGNNCSMTCQVRGNYTLPCDVEESQGNQLVTFIVYLFIRLLCGFAINISFTLMDASLLQMVEDFDGDVGINRAFCAVGSCAVPPLSGLLIDYASSGNDVDYSPAFYIFAVCTAFSAITLCFTDLRARTPSKNVLSKATKLIKYPRVLAFITIYAFIGLAWGFLETFLFWFLDVDLQAPKWFLGLTNTVGSLAGLPFAIFSTWIIKRTGYTKIFVFGLFVFGLRFIGYSLVENIWWVLPLEALEALTGTLPITAASIYASTFDAELLATLQGVISAVHFGIGRGVGSLMGGLMIGHMGTRMSFQIVAAICIGYSLLHTLLHYTYLRRLPRPKKTTSANKSQASHSSKKERDSMIGMKEVVEDDSNLHGNHANQPEFGQARLSFLALSNPAEAEAWGSSYGLQTVGLTRRTSLIPTKVDQEENLNFHRITEKPLHMDIV